MSSMISQAVVFRQSNKVIIGTIASFQNSCKFCVFDLYAVASLLHEDQRSTSPKLMTTASSSRESASFFMRYIDEELLANSILSSTISPKAPLLASKSLSSTLAGARSWEEPSKSKDGKLINQPVTFHSKIRSSGYGQGAKNSYERMLVKKQDASKRRQLLLQKERSRSDGSLSDCKAEKLVALNGPIVGSRPMSYDTDADCPTLSQDHLLYKPASSPTAAAVAPSPILKIVFNNLGTNMAMLTNESSINTFHINPSRRRTDGK
jgi:hypothetical protein